MFGWATVSAVNTADNTFTAFVSQNNAGDGPPTGIFLQAQLNIHPVPPLDHFITVSANVLCVLWVEAFVIVHDYAVIS